MDVSRKRKQFSLSENTNILSDFDNNFGTQNALAEHLRISKSKFAIIVKQRVEIEKGSVEVAEKSSKIRNQCSITFLVDE